MEPVDRHWVPEYNILIIDIILVVGLPDQSKAILLVSPYKKYQLCTHVRLTRYISFNYLQPQEKFPQL